MLVHNFSLYIQSYLTSLLTDDCQNPLADSDGHQSVLHSDEQKSLLDCHDPNLVHESGNQKPFLDFEHQKSVTYFELVKKLAPLKPLLVQRCCQLMVLQN
jgi:hypothetical protein